MNGQSTNPTLSRSFVDDVAEMNSPISAVELAVDDDFTFAISCPAVSDYESPAFPLFNLELLSDLNPNPMELGSGSTSSSSSVEVEEDGYCVWNADRARKKSASAGTGSRLEPESKSRWCKLLGRRNVSDGKGKFEYLNAVTGLKSDSGKKGKKKDGKEMDLVTAHKLFYGNETKNGKKTFLPYRQDLVVLW